MSYNVGFGGRDPAWKRVFEQENPDIAVLVEVGTWDDRRDALLDQYVAEFNAHFAGQPPYRGDVAQNTPRVNTGLALLSRYPIVEVTQLSRVTLDDGTEFDPTHDLMIWTVDAGGERIRVVGVYLKCCGGPANRDIRDRTMEGLINALDALGDVPLILMGDFNSFSPRDTGPLAPSGNLAAGPLSMLLSPRDPTYGGRASAVHAFTDAFRALAPDAPGYTYGHRSRKYKSRIDFILVNQHLADRLAGPATVGDTEAARAGSDHFSVDVRLSLGAGATAAR
jgi:endonuclease/exonuclease/phosphatase family metal-dependent hydrolase